MAKPPALRSKPTSVGPTALGAEYAPFIYFDGCMTYGVNFGVIQIELGANVIVPNANTTIGARTDVVTTVHLRCSLNAATDLLHAIQKVLAMMEKSQEPQQQARSKIN
jgi:hypothetical protein